MTITMEELSGVSPPIFNGNRNGSRALSRTLSCRDTMGLAQEQN